MHLYTSVHYICDCIYTYQYIIVLSTRLLKSTETISHQPLPVVPRSLPFLALLSCIEWNCLQTCKQAWNKRKLLGIGMTFSTTVQEKKPWDHQVSDVSFYRLPFPLQLAPWSRIRCCMVSSSHLTA